MLITRSPKLTEAADHYGRTALHYLAANGQEKMVEMLIAKSPKLLDTTDNNGWTALNFATVNGEEKIVEILTKAKDDLALQSKDLKIEGNKVANKSDQESSTLLLGTDYVNEPKVKNFLLEETNLIYNPNCA